MSTPYSSEWPVDLLLDEIWLRVRRTLVTALEKASLWPGTAEHQAFLSSQRARGEALRDAALLGALTEEDRRWLLSPSMFGASNRRFRARTPLSLAFGYTLSEELQKLLGNPVDDMVAETCGLFNFGISVFDLLHDAQPKLVPEFKEYFNKQTLLQLNSDPTSSIALRTAALTCGEPELRLLLQTIAAVYDRLYDLAKTASADASAKIRSLLVEAYEAEMRSSFYEPAADLLDVSRDKSSLPFRIIGAIGALRGRDSSSHSFQEALTGDLGTIFWLTDDLIDVIGDVRSGALNSLLVRSAGGETLDVGNNLRRIIDDGLIDEAVITIRDALRRIRSIAPNTSSGLVRSFDRFLALYIRTWIE